jgi:hypothetical protein
VKELLVTVHGVGETAAGQTILGLSTVLSPQNAYTRADLVLNGQQYARLRSTEPDQPDLIEVNWSDVERPRRSTFGVLRHWLKLSFATLHLGAGWPARPMQKNGQADADSVEMRPLPTGRLVTPLLYRGVMELYAVWVVYPVLFCLGWVTLDAVPRTAFVAGVFALVAGLLAITWTWSPCLRYGGCCCLLILAVLIIALCLWPERELGAVAATTWAYCLGQYAAVALIPVILVELLWRLGLREAVRPPSVVCLAMNYLPLVALSMFGAVVWAGVLNVVVRMTDTEAMQKWARAFLENLFYDVMWVEWVTAGVTAGIAVLCGVGAALYGGRSKHASQTEVLPGRFAQNLLLALLATMPFLLALPAVAMLGTFELPPRGTPDHAVSHVVTVYTVSATRAIPVLGLLVTPFAIVLHVLADVILYLAREDTALSAPTRFQERLAVLLTHLGGKYDRIWVLAHSQGSVIALDVIRSQPRSVRKSLALITLGSPLGALYQRFLGCQLEEIGDLRWINVYRSGDYVGGPIDLLNDKNKMIGEGGHVNYWADDRIHPVLKLLGEAKPVKVDRQRHAHL